MASSTEGVARFSTYAFPFPETTTPADTDTGDDVVTAAVNRTIGGVRSCVSLPIPPGVKEALPDVFTGLCWADAYRVADIIIPLAYRYWRYDDADNPELTQALRNRGLCATSRLDGIDWVDPDKVCQALPRAATAVQPNMIVVDLGMSRETPATT